MGSARECLSAETGKNKYGFPKILAGLKIIQTHQLYTTKLKGSEASQITISGLATSEHITSLYGYKRTEFLIMFPISNTVSQNGISYFRGYFIFQPLKIKVKICIDSRAVTSKG